MTEILGVKFYSVAEVAETLAVTAQTVRKYIKEERLPAQKIGRGYYVAEPKLKSFLGIEVDPEEVKQEDQL